MNVKIATKAELKAHLETLSFHAELKTSTYADGSTVYHINATHVGTYDKGEERDWQAMWDAWMKVQLGGGAA